MSHREKFKDFCFFKWITIPICTYCVYKKKPGDLQLERSLLLLLKEQAVYFIIFSRGKIWNFVYMFHTHFLYQPA